MGGENVKEMQYNPCVRDNGKHRYSLEEACDMVREDTWKWRGGNIAADCDPNDSSFLRILRKEEVESLDLYHGEDRFRFAGAARFHCLLLS